MKNQRSGSHCRNPWIPGVFILLIVIGGILPAAADDSATALGVIPAKSNIANLAFANQPAGTYYFKFDQTGGGGINALHIASSSATAPNYGEVTTTTSQSGTFYITDTGGRGYQDEAILLVAVKGTIPDNFAIHIKSSGYSWTPTGTMNEPPASDKIIYHAGAVDQTFTKAQFVYGPQTWRPAGNNAPSDYPLYYGQDTSDTTNTFKLMFVDLRAGPLGTNGDIDVNALNDKGAVKVEYTMTNLDSVTAFNAYAWNEATTQGKGISWSNGLTSGGSNPSAISGYTVLGTNYADRASEFPTKAGSTPEYHAPATNFSSDVTSGTAPLTVKFSDSTAQSVKTWSWDFGDGGTSVEKNPEHTYTTEGKFTVALTAANNQGLSATKTQTDYITVTAASGGSGSGSSGGGDGLDGGGSENGNTSGSIQGNHSVSTRVAFTANSTAGVPPLAVTFHDATTIRNISAWEWDFNGDNIPDSTEQNPAFVFRKVGNYSVNLTIKTVTGKIANLTRFDYICITDVPPSEGSGWISSDQYDTGQDPAGAGLSAGGPVQSTNTPAPKKGQEAGSPLGTKVAEILLDGIIVIGVIGVGVILWKKM